MDRLNTCKRTGCTEPIQDRAGPLRQALRRPQSRRSGPQAFAAAPPKRGLAADVRDLAKTAAKVERLVRKLAGAGGAAEKRRLIAATKAVQTEVTEENVAELAAATKAYSKGLPARARDERELAKARAELRDGLRALTTKVDRAAVEDEQRAA